MKKILTIALVLSSTILFAMNNSDEGKKKKKKENTEAKAKEETNTKSAVKKPEGTAEEDRLKTKSAYEKTVNTTIK